MKGSIKHGKAKRLVTLVMLCAILLGNSAPGVYAENSENDTSDSAIEETSNTNSTDDTSIVFSEDTSNDSNSNTQIDEDVIPTTENDLESIVTESKQAVLESVASEEG